MVSDGRPDMGQDEPSHVATGNALGIERAVNDG
jgi:hypothetical protein